MFCFHFFSTVEQITKLVTYLHDAQTWEGAGDKCNERGLRLLAINSEEKNAQVEQVLQGLNETYEV